MTIVKMNGSARLKNNVWWFCVKASTARGSIEKGFSRRTIYKYPITNPENISFNGQTIEVSVSDKKATIL
jgi:hypothetical protein